MPRPSSISVCSARETTSRERELHRVRRVALQEALALGVAGGYAPSPRQPSVISTPLGDSVVGWNCMISMSFSGTPARSAIVIPSPVHD